MTTRSMLDQHHSGCSQSELSVLFNPYLESCVDDLDQAPNFSGGTTQFYHPP